MASKLFFWGKTKCITWLIHNHNVAEFHGGRHILKYTFFFFTCFWAAIRFWSLFLQAGSWMCRNVLVPVVIPVGLKSCRYLYGKYKIYEIRNTVKGNIFFFFKTFSSTLRSAVFSLLKNSSSSLPHPQKRFDIPLHFRHTTSDCNLRTNSLQKQYSILTSIQVSYQLIMFLGEQQDSSHICLIMI